jgi:SAM-dependent methyltransferase
MRSHWNTDKPAARWIVGFNFWNEFFYYLMYVPIKLILEIMKPGYCEESTIWIKDERLFKQIASFIGYGLRGTMADIGESNAKMEYLKDKLCWEVEQINEGDFNFDQICDIKGNDNIFDIIFCFEILEHLQNPLWFATQLKRSVVKDGTLFLSLPGRPKLLWTEHHFREYTPKELKKWILEPLGLKIIRKKKLRITRPFWFYFTGIRPFLRIFFDFTVIYEIKHK